MLDAIQAGVDADRAYYSEHPDRMHRCRRASPDEIPAALSLCLYQTAGGAEWHAFSRVVCRSPMMVETIYLRGGGAGFSAVDHGEDWAARWFRRMHARTVENCAALDPAEAP